MIQKLHVHPHHLLIMDQAASYFGMSDKNSKSEFATTLHITPDPHVYVSSTAQESNDSEVFRLPTNSDDNQLENDGLFKNLKKILIFGKIIGVIPYSGVFGDSSKNMTFRPKSLTAFVSYVIVGILLFNVSLGTIDSMRAPKTNALEIANSIRQTMYFIWGTYVYITFIYRSKDFLRIFQAWEATHVVYTRKDVTLHRDVMVIAVTILLSAILENSVLHLEYFKELDHVSGINGGPSQKNMTTLEVFMWRGHSHWAKLIGYNWFLAVVAFIQHKWILYSWNYVDVLIAVMARAIYFRFKCLYEVAEKVLLGPKDRWLQNDVGESKVFRDPNAWLQVVHDHKHLCRLLDVLETFFSPLVFASYLVNMFYVSLQLLDGLTSEATHHSIIHSIYAPWSFLHLIMRIFVISITAARINVYAHKIRILFQECPPECYSTEVSRLDKRVTSGPDIGLTGLQSFTVTKPFILSILSTIFTFEIVLLQCVPTDDTVPKCPK